jgi:very-short-patch-repair endonuclease
LFLFSPISALRNGGDGRHLHRTAFGAVQVRPEGVILYKRTSPKIFHRAKELRHNKTPEEEKLWARLRNHQLDRIGFRQHTCPGGRCQGHAIGDTIVDFCSPHRKLVIELDGNQHLEAVELDAERTAFLNSKGYKMIRFLNHEVNENIEDVLQGIRIACYK